MEFVNWDHCSQLNGKIKNVSKPPIRILSKTISNNASLVWHSCWSQVRRPSSNSQHRYHRLPKSWVALNIGYPVWWTATLNELERSTMLFWWVNQLFPLGHVQVRKLLANCKLLPAASPETPMAQLSILLDDHLAEKKTFGGQVPMEKPGKNRRKSLGPMRCLSGRWDFPKVDRKAVPVGISAWCGDLRKLQITCFGCYQCYSSLQIINSLEKKNYASSWFDLWRSHVSSS